jgi:lipoprotein-releasing system permease protein
MWPFFLSLKYVFSRRKEGMISIIGGISVLGVTLGVAALIVVLSVMNGFDHEVKDKIIGTYSQITVTSYGGLEEDDTLLSSPESFPGVKSSAPFVNGQALLIKGRDNTKGVLVKGIDPEREKSVTDIGGYSGLAVNGLSRDSIVLGSELMFNAGIRKGDVVELLVPYSSLDMEKKEFVVAGGFTSGRYDYDANIAIISIGAAQDIFRTGEKVSGAGIRTSAQDEKDLLRVKDELAEALGPGHNVKTWMDLDRNLMQALAVEKKMMFSILAIIVVVACFNISGSLIMMVMEKTKDIGILKAVGAGFSGVSSVFLFVGSLVAFAGISSGTVLGVFIAKNINFLADAIEKATGLAVFPNDIYYFSEIPVRIDLNDVISVMIMAFLLALAAGLYPAVKAARMDPVEAIRYE